MIRFHDKATGKPAIIDPKSVIAITPSSHRPDPVALIHFGDPSHPSVLVTTVDPKVAIDLIFPED